MPWVDLDLVAERMFRGPRVRRRLCRDYGLEPEPEDSGQLASALVDSFGQAPIKGSASGAISNRDVFRAAVRALGSNSRSWSSFIRNEPRIAELLCDYDPATVTQSHASGQLSVVALKACLPGQTGGADAKAMVAWASVLVRAPAYYDSLLRLRNALSRNDISGAELTPTAAAVLGAPTKRTQLRFPPPDGLHTWKTPGMRAVLASEFLRNLRWNGFKPDRHIRRLFGMWFPDIADEKAERARELGCILGSSSKELLEFLTYSLVGVSVTPSGRTFTEVDNLVWALGAYLEKKGKESSTCYRMDSWR